MVDIVFAYLAVSSLGKEFQNRTINMIRVSDLSGREVILRKLLSFLILSIVAATIYSCSYYLGFRVDFLQVLCAACRFSFVGLRQTNLCLFSSLWDFYLYGFNFDYLTFKEYLNSFCNSLSWGNRNNLLYTLFG